MDYNLITRLNVSSGVPLKRPSWEMYIACLSRDLHSCQRGGASCGLGELSVASQ